MGTTLTAVIPDGHGVLVGHVGDSRAYLLRDGELRQLTTDHSLVEELVREGRLTEQEAAVHPQRSIITRALGVEGAVDVDVYSVPLEAGDRLLLCSDGLTTMLRADDIAALLRRESDPTRAANLLVDAANAAGGEDNITTIVIDVEEDGIDPLAPAPVAAAATTATPVVPVPTAPEAARRGCQPGGGRGRAGRPDVGPARGRERGQGAGRQGAPGEARGTGTASLPRHRSLRALRRPDHPHPRARGRDDGLVRAAHLLRRVRPIGSGHRVPGPAGRPAPVGPDRHPAQQAHEERPPGRRARGCSRIRSSSRTAATRSRSPGGSKRARPPRPAPRRQRRPRRSSPR